MYSGCFTLFDKLGLCECVETRPFLFWQVMQDLNKMKQISKTLLNTLVSRKRAKFQQNLLNSMVVGTHFFRQITLFLKNNRALSKFLCGILHYLISITKLSKNQSM